jgi:hypothetical protein
MRDPKGVDLFYLATSKKTEGRLAFLDRGTPPFPQTYFENNGGARVKNLHFMRTKFDKNVTCKQEISRHKKLAISQKKPICKKNRIGRHGLSYIKHNRT